jgi:L-amino acid N-acyltransferase YncA
MQTLTHRRLDLRIATAPEFTRMLSENLEHDIWRYVLKPRFFSVEACVGEVCDPHKPGYACLCFDEAGELAGWGCCFRFHERVGYAGTLQMVVYSGSDETSDEMSDALHDVLYAACESACRRQAAHTLVALVDSRMKAAYRWFSRSVFSACGAIDLRDDARLHVFSTRMRP